MFQFYQLTELVPDCGSDRGFVHQFVLACSPFEALLLQFHCCDDALLLILRDFHLGFGEIS